MTSLAVAGALSTIFVPIGFAGATWAVICALVAGFALARGSAGLCGGAAGLWIVGALLSVASAFTSEWSPLLVSLAALAAALTVGGLVRAGIAARRAASGEERAFG